MRIAHGDGSFGKRLLTLAKTDLLILDDCGLAPLSQAERSGLLEVLDDRVGTRATLITSQLPVEHWHVYLNDPTLADAILDRVLRAAHKLTLSGESLRKHPEASMTISAPSPAYPPRRPPLVIGEPPAPGTVDNPAAAVYFANSVTATSRSS